jgi:hypothetical protein
MADYPDLDRLVEEATFFPGLNVRLAALRPLMNVAEEQLAISRKLAIARVRSEHTRMGDDLHPEDRTFALQELEQQVTLLLPKLTRGGLILTIWSIFERSVKDIAIKAAEYTGQPLSRNHFRSGALMDRLEQALSQSANLTVHADPAQILALKQLAAVRHALIHHDGRLEECDSIIAKLNRSELDEIGIQIERDYDFEYIVPKHEFVVNCAEVVYAYVHSLSSRVFEKLVPPNVPAV